MGKANMFAEAAGKRAEDQAKMEEAVAGVRTPAIKAAPEKPGRPAKGTGSTITLSIKEADRRIVKSWAAAHGTTVSKLFADWIHGHCK